LGSGAVWLPKRSLIVRDRMESNAAQGTPHLPAQSRKSQLLKLN
jgi:hypothetical protein